MSRERRSPRGGSFFFGGIARSSSVWRTAWMSRLASGSPGVMAGPRVAAFLTPARESSSRPPFDFFRRGAVAFVAMFDEHRPDFALEKLSLLRRRSAGERGAGSGSGIAPSPAQTSMPERFAAPPRVETLSFPSMARALPWAEPLPCPALPLLNPLITTWSFTRRSNRSLWLSSQT